MASRYFGIEKAIKNDGENGQNEMLWTKIAIFQAHCQSMGCYLYTRT